MKIHNYGNDYAYQQKQKSKESKKAQIKNEEVKKVQVEEPKNEEVKNAGNQIQDGRERKVEELGAQGIGGMEKMDETETGMEEKSGEESAGTNTKKKKKTSQEA